jgi:serine/threonine protein phosphatase PrpC
MTAAKATPTPPPSNPAAHVRWSGMTHTGRVRPNNEDVFLALTFDEREVRFLGKTGDASLANADFIFAVSDGMGGAKSGEFASRITVDRVTRLLPRRFSRAPTHAQSPERFTTILGELVAAIHTDLLNLGSSYEECSGMGATLTLAWLTPRQLYFAHVGDSRLYHLPAAGGCTQLTHDHTHVGWLRRQGKINEREARAHPMRNALHQSLGAGNQFVDPHLGVVDHQPGDRFVLCSDGVTDGLWERHLDELVRTPPPERAGQPIAQRLVEEAVAQSGRDNATAVVVDILPPLAPSPS